MLKGIDPRLVPQLLLALAEMGHGDVVAVVDRNFPAHSAGSRVVELPDADAAGAIEAILTVLPVDRMQSPAITHMLTDDGEESPATPLVRAVWEAAEGGAVAAAGVDRRSRSTGWPGTPTLRCALARLCPTAVISSPRGRCRRDCAGLAPGQVLGNR